MVDLTGKFDSKARDASGAEIEKLRADYYIQAKMSGSDDKAIGGVTVNIAGRENTTTEKNRKKQETTADTLALLQIQIAELEHSLIDQYGENFDLDLAAEYFDEETYKQLASIEDPEERRKAVAQAINEGIKNGTIDPADIYSDPTRKEWLDKHEKLANTRGLNSDIDVGYNKNIEVDHSEEAAFDDLFSGNDQGFNPT